MDKQQSRKQHREELKKRFLEMSADTFDPALLMEVYNSGLFFEDHGLMHHALLLTTVAFCLHFDDQVFKTYFGALTGEEDTSHIEKDEPIDPSL